MYFPDFFFEHGLGRKFLSALCFKQTDNFNQINTLWLSGRAMTQVLSGWLLTKEARFQSQAILCRICGGKSSTGRGFSKSILLQFTIVSFIQLALHYHSVIYHGRYIILAVSSVLKQQTKMIKCWMTADVSICTIQGIWQLICETWEAMLRKPALLGKLPLVACLCDLILMVTCLKTCYTINSGCLNNINKRGNEEWNSYIFPVGFTGNCA